MSGWEEARSGRGLGSPRLCPVHDLLFGVGGYHLRLCCLVRAERRHIIGSPFIHTHLCADLTFTGVPTTTANVRLEPLGVYSLKRD